MHINFLEPAVELQKHAIRTIAGAQRYVYTTPLFTDLKLLNIKEIYIYWVQLFMYKKLFCFQFSLIGMSEIIQFMKMIPGNIISSMFH